VKITLLILFIFYSFSLFAQEEFTDAKRSEYLLSIPKYVKWKNDKDIDTLVYAILDTNKLFFNFFADSSSGKSVRNKPVKAKYVYSPLGINNCNIVYVKRGSGFDVQDIVSTVSGRNILLITENYSFNSSMVNFIVFEGKRSFEINKERIVNEGFTINPLWEVHAVTRKADWELLYMKTEDLLGKEKQKVEEQKQVISLQEIKLAVQQATIEVLQRDIDEQVKKLKVLRSNIFVKQYELVEKTKILEERKKELQEQRKLSQRQMQEIAESKQVLSNLEIQRKELKEELQYNFSLIETQRYIIYLFILVLILVLVASYFVYKAFRLKKLTNKKLREKNEEITAQNEEIVSQRDRIALQNEEITAINEEVVAQRDKIAFHQKEITDSINYASNIQRAILPSESVLKDANLSHFILYKPRDIVSGDFYWFTHNIKYTVLIAADSTGHGVPGAFMSIMGVSFLNEIVNHKNFYMPHEILGQLRMQIVSALNQSGKIETKDGMDMTVSVIDNEKKKLYVSGAYNSLFFVRNNELQVIKADKMPVGLSEKMDVPFSCHEIQLEPNDIFYMFSDGYADQFGGPKNKKFMSKRFKELLVSICDKDLEDQKYILDSSIEEWMGDVDQIDDIVVFGTKIN